jgi:tetratricopeptide (TPR) repeat protein
MIPIICLVFLFLSQAFPQKDSSGYFNINSPSNIKKFADYLFCADDYLRAATEYEKYLSSYYNDTVEFKIGLSYSKISNYSKALKWFNKINNNSVFFADAGNEYFKSLFQLGNYYDFRRYYQENKIKNKDKIRNADKLFYFSYFFTEDELPPEVDFLKPFNSKESNKINEFYKRKINPPYKSTAAAIIMSALIPGSGKIYTGQVGDGIITAIATGLCGYLAYDNFDAEHNFRGWVFSCLAVFFYAGNVYGSAASAQIYNAGIRFDFQNDIKLYLNRQNYFTSKYDFCK